MNKERRSAMAFAFGRMDQSLNPTQPRSGRDIADAELAILVQQASFDLRTEETVRLYNELNKDPRIKQVLEYAQGLNRLTGIRQGLAYARGKDNEVTSLVQQGLEAVRRVTDNPPKEGEINNADN